MRQGVTALIAPFRQAACAQLVAVILLAAAGPVIADDDTTLQATVGVKAWENEWTSWYPVLNPASATRVVEPIDNNFDFVLIPQASLRYGDFLVAGSYFVNKTYSLSGAVDPTSGNPVELSPRRHEFDVNGGYYVFPSLAITAGYKRVEQDFGSSRYTWSGPTIGLSGSAQLHGPIAVYGAFAYGFMRLHASVPDDADQTSYDADYTLGEVGLAYLIPTQSSLLSFSVSLGYRVQTVRTRDFAIATPHSGYADIGVHDVTQGPALGVVTRF